MPFKEGDENRNFKEGRRVTMSFRTTEERRAAVKELAAAMSTTDDKKTVSDILNQLIDDAYDALNQKTEAFLPASPPPRHRPTPQPAPTPSADDEPTPPTPSSPRPPLPIDKAWKLVRMNEGGTKTRGKQEYTIHGQIFGPDDIIKWAEKYR